MNDDKVVNLFRLDQSQYDMLEKQLLNNDILVNEKTTDLQAGYLLGIQHCLRKLRNGFTHG